MRKTKPSAAREATLRARQDPPCWGTEYVPGQFATREEAPDYSRPSIIYSYWLRRHVHVMSEPELYCFLLASWLSCFHDLHESRMMHPEPCGGFLVGKPALDQRDVGAHSGSIMAAERLGLLQFHPVIHTLQPSAGRKSKIGFPMLADQVYFSKDCEGIFGLNWCIKNDPIDFVTAFQARGPTDRIKSDEEHQARLLIEAEVFREARMRTVHVSKQDIPLHLRENLRFLHQFMVRAPALPDALGKDFIATVNERIQKNVPPFETINRFTQKHGGAVYDYQIHLFQSIWRKDVRCDLCRPINVDVPLRPTDAKLETKFAMWCQRNLA